MVDVQRGSDQIHERCSELAERTDGTLTVLDGSGVAAGNRDGWPEVQLVADDRQRRDRAEPNDGPELVGRVGDEVPVEAQDVGRVLCRPEDRSGDDGRADWVQREPERADDAEVPAAASQRPEEVGVVVGRRPHDVALAVTTSASTRLSTVSPCLRMSHPMPPPRLRPPTPVWPTMPPVVARPWACVSWSTSPHRAPPWTRAVRSTRSTETARIAERSMTIPSSHTAVPATLWPPPRTAISRSQSRAKRTAAATSAVPLQRAISRGRRSTDAVPYGSGVVVVMVVGGDQDASEPGDLHGGWCCHRSSSGGWAHRNIGGHRGEVSYLDFEVRNLDFTEVGRRGTLRS